MSSANRAKKLAAVSGIAADPPAGAPHPVAALGLMLRKASELRHEADTAVIEKRDPARQDAVEEGFDTMCRLCDYLAGRIVETEAVTTAGALVQIVQALAVVNDIRAFDEGAFQSAYNLDKIERLLKSAAQGIERETGLRVEALTDPDGYRSRAYLTFRDPATVMLRVRDVLAGKVDAI